MKIAIITLQLLFAWKLIKPYTHSLFSTSSFRRQQLFFYCNWYSFLCSEKKQKKWRRKLCWFLFTLFNVPFTLHIQNTQYNTVIVIIQFYYGAIFIWKDMWIGCRFQYETTSLAIVGKIIKIFQLEKFTFGNKELVVSFHFHSDKCCRLHFIFFLSPVLPKNKEVFSFFFSCFYCCC